MAGERYILTTGVRSKQAEKAQSEIPGVGGEGGWLGCAPLVSLGSLGTSIPPESVSRNPPSIG